MQQYRFDFIMIKPNLKISTISFSARYQERTLSSLEKNRRKFSDFKEVCSPFLRWRLEIPIHARLFHFINRLTIDRLDLHQQWISSMARDLVHGNYHLDN